MKLTVCTAVMNAVGAGGADALERCLRSVAALPFEHEHLVYDGASADGTAELLAKLAAELGAVRVVSERDRGIYDALDKGVRDARGEYFYVLGADDYIFDPAALAAMVGAAAAGKYDVMIAPVEIDGGETRPKPWRDAYSLDFGMTYPHQGALIRTALLRELGGYDRDFRIAADYALHLSAHLRGARTGEFRTPFAHFSLGGLSGGNLAAVNGESCRVRIKVLGLSAAEAERHRRTGGLPLRVARGFLRLPDAFARRVGRACLLHWLWRKHRTEEASVRYFLGMPVWRHRRAKGRSA